MDAADAVDGTGVTWIWRVQAARPTSHQAQSILSARDLRCGTLTEWSLRRTVD